MPPNRYDMPPSLGELDKKIDCDSWGKKLFYFVIIIEDIEDIEDIQILNYSAHIFQFF